MNTVTQKRKQRIAEARKKRMRARNKKIAVSTIAGAITALVLMNGKAGACSTDYTVKTKDTLYSLSKKYQVSVEQLMEANSLISETIVVGQRLVVPGEQLVENSTLHTVQKGDTLFSLAKKYRTTVDELKKKNNIHSDKINIGQKILVSIETPTNGEQEMYTVFQGDTLWGIAKQFGVTAEDLAKENGLSKKMVLIGQKLFIPGAVDFSEAEVVGAADNFTVEFEQQDKQQLILKVPYGAASDYEKKSGQKVTVIHKNGAVISAF
ncbi:MAG: LysM peptidoglycan-binding domain-containing protein [Bacillota bacterium]